MVEAHPEVIAKVLNADVGGKRNFSRSASVGDHIDRDRIRLDSRSKVAREVDGRLDYRARE